MSDYDPSVLPHGFYWDGAIAAPDGFNGHAFIANVARDQDGKCWCFSVHGRFRISKSFLEEHRISFSPLHGVPIHLDPASQHSRKIRQR